MEDPCKGNAKNELPEDMTEQFPGTNVSDQCTNLFLKQDNSTAGDQTIVDQQIESYIQQNGYPVLYYPYLFEVDKSEKVHGEHSAAGYGQPFQVIMFMTIEDAPSWVSQLGVDSDVTVTAWLHIKTWKQCVQAILKTPKDSRYEDYSKIYNLNYIEDRDIIHAIEPKPKDLIQLTTFGCDREYSRGNQIFEITNKEDNLFSANMMVAGGHYVWKLVAKRYRFSYEEGMSRLDDKAKNNPYLGILGEKGNFQAYENLSVTELFLKEEGIEPGTKEFKKLYNQDIDEESKAEFDMSQHIPGYYDNNNPVIHWNGFA